MWYWHILPTMYEYLDHIQFSIHQKSLEKAIFIHLNKY